MQQKYYPTALEEIKKGIKLSHWIWFIFPQIEGLGKSEMCKQFELKTLKEAKEYLNNDYLLNNLISITKQLLSHKNKKIFDIMNFDDKKLLSSMTLFNIADNNNKCNGIFQEVINTFYNGQQDQLTINILKMKEIKNINYHMNNLQMVKNKQQKSPEHNLFINNQERNRDNNKYNYNYLNNLNNSNNNIPKGVVHTFYDDYYNSSNISNNKNSIPVDNSSFSEINQENAEHLLNTGGLQTIDRGRVTNYDDKNNLEPISHETRKKNNEYRRDNGKSFKKDNNNSKSNNCRMERFKKI